jgi:hypothetical protein
MNGLPVVRSRQLIRALQRAGFPGTPLLSDEAIGRESICGRGEMRMLVDTNLLLRPTQPDINTTLFLSIECRLYLTHRRSS